MSNSIHDMGGMHGFGPVVAEPSEPPFHAAWEGRVMAMQRAMGYTRLWTIDGGRASIESLPPLTYLAASYYEKWFLGLEKRVVAHGLVGEDELAAGRIGTTRKRVSAVESQMRISVSGGNLTPNSARTPFGSITARER